MLTLQENSITRIEEHNPKFYCHFDLLDIDGCNSIDNSSYLIILLILLFLMLSQISAIQEN